MWKIGFALLALGALLAPAQALPQNGGFSGVKHYTGPVDQPATGTGVGPPSVELFVKFKHGKPIKVTRFLAWRVRKQCPDGTSVVPYSPRFDEIPFQPKVKRGRFSATSQSEHISVTGRITRHGGASGTLRAWVQHVPVKDPNGGDLYPPQYQDCDSGPLSWTAKRK